jgi:uncharacterized protein (TIGR04255 family)
VNTGPRAASNAPLPDFSNPPVIETAIGVVFLPIDGWKLSHFNRFGRQIESRYPSAEPQERFITTPLEEFGAPAKPTELVFESGAALWWYVDEKNGRLIQLQRDRFVQNWRKIHPEDTYPHYERTREEFKTAWSEYLAFLTQERLPHPTVLQVEIDYVNHIERGQGWTTPADIPKVTPLLAAQRPQFLPSPEAILLNARYLMPAKRGRLHVSLQPAIRNADKVELLQMTISAHGRPSGSELDSIVSWCDLGHEWIVRGFADVTTVEMHERWGRIR